MNRIPQNDPEFLRFQKQVMDRRKKAAMRKALITLATVLLLAAILTAGVFAIYQAGKEPIDRPENGTDLENGENNTDNRYPNTNGGTQNGNGSNEGSQGTTDEGNQGGSEEGSENGAGGEDDPSGGNDTQDPSENDEQKITVYIDAGHGFTNSVGTPDKGTGTDTPYYDLTGKYESDLNLEIALALKQILTEKGYAVVMSRESQVDEHLTINQRVDRVNDTECDIFISIHANSFDNASVGGARIYYSSLNDNAIKCKRYASAVAAALNALEGVSQREVTVEDHPDIGVIKGVKVPTVLVESCFLTNQTDAELAASEEWILKMATGLCTGIESYLAQMAN